MERLRRAWRAVATLDPRLVDVAMAIALAAGAAAQLLLEGPQRPQNVVSALGTGLPLAWRRRFPVAAHLAQIALAILGARQPVPIATLAVFIGLYSVAAYARWRWAAPVIVVVGGLVLLVLVPASAQTVPSWASALVGGSALWLAGRAVRENRARADVLAERAERLERERDLTTRLALAAERQRIARELHDVVAHSVSVMVVQAGAARTLLTRQPPRATEALLAVESGGREALGELRRLLGLLTDPDAEPSLAPQPGLAQLDRLVERVGQAGLPVDVKIAGTPRRLPTGLDLTAYRIVQEALTNALKHAGGARCDVLVEFGGRELRLEVVDAGGSPAAATGDGAGRGLLGMQERIAAYGGELRAGPRPEGGFAVRARLPLPAEPA
ncbi:MAG TPA: histidine kinase [Chloroflexota bacterium]|nr:histidine kinase [Chloroflexota bacterium]